VKENNNGNGNLNGFIIGALGEGVALLLAPRTGKEAWNRLARSTWEIKDRATTSFEQAKATVRRKREIAIREAKEILRALELNR
jgi:gas vesicle protein